MEQEEKIKSALETAWKQYNKEHMYELLLSGNDEDAMKWVIEKSIELLGQPQQSPVGNGVEAGKRLSETDMDNLYDKWVCDIDGKLYMTRDLFKLALQELYRSQPLPVTEGRELEDKMPATLLELGFIHVANEGIQGAYKTYKGFKLWVAQDPVDKHWIAQLQVKGMDIQIPLTIDAIWIYGFDKDNNGYPSPPKH